MEYPKNQIEFERRFSSEDLCRDYFIELRWPEGFLCQRCGTKEYWEKSRNRMACKQCNYECTLTSGTLLEKSHLSLGIWFHAAWWMTNQKHGVSALGLQRALGIGSYKTAWNLLHKLRGAMVNPAREMLSGRIEVDETSIGGRGKGHESRWKNKQLVLIAAEIDGVKTGRIRMQLIENGLAQTLSKSVKELIKPGSTLITDGWNGYFNAKTWGYGHEVHIAEHALGEEEKLPRIHRVASLFKRWLLGTHHGRIDKKHLQSYADEFVFRFNRRTSNSRGLLFHRLMQNVAKNKVSHPSPNH